MLNQFNYLDIVGATTLAIMYTVNATLLVHFAKIGFKAKVAIWIVIGLWVYLIGFIGVIGGFAPGVMGVLPTPVVVFTFFLATLLLGWFIWPTYRKAFESIPLAVLIGINSFRIGGIFFLLLWQAGKLSAPFAPFAGWGDIITGIVALPLSIMVATGRMPSRWLIKGWNIFGAIDLVLAITLAFFSVPNAPWRIFMEAPGAGILAMLPWVGVPTILVPLYLVIHFVIWRRLSADK